MSRSDSRPSDGPTTTLRVLARAVAATGSGVLITDPTRPDNPIISANPAFSRLTGYSAEEIVGRNCRFLQGPGTDREAVALIRAAVAAGRECTATILNYRKDGTPFWNELSIAPVFDEGGRLVNFIGIQSDVSERKRLEEERAELLGREREARAAAEAAVRDRDDFVAMVIHDLRTPLTSLKGYAQLMQRRRSYSDEAVEAIVDQASRLERLVADLLDVARIRGNLAELRLADVDLVAQLRSCVRQAGAESPAHLVRMEAPEGPIAGRWDPDRLAQIFQNLLSNAIKYSPEGGEILVRVEDVPGEARVSIRDRGIGISARALPHLFEQFYRVDTSTEGPTGLGLGLHIARTLVEAHGGRIGAESGGEDRGSTFVVSLPRDDAGRPAPPGGRS